MALSLTKNNPKLIVANKFVLGAGWDSRADLDLSLIPKFKGQIDLSLITFFKNLQTVYATHSGDNPTGDGDGDDEVVIVDLSKVPVGIDVIFVSVYCYSQGTFGDVVGEYFKLYDEKGDVKISVELDDIPASNSATHLIPIKFVRTTQIAGAESRSTEPSWVVEFVGRYDNIPNQDLGPVVELLQTI